MDRPPMQDMAEEMVSIMESIARKEARNLLKAACAAALADPDLGTEGAKEWELARDRAQMAEWGSAYKAEVRAFRAASKAFAGSVLQWLGRHQEAGE